MKPILPLIDELQKEIRQREHILITADTINTMEKVERYRGEIRGLGRAIILIEKWYNNDTNII